jgi:hypothetical protein
VSHQDEGELAQVWPLSKTESQLANKKIKNKKKKKDNHILAAISTDDNDIDNNLSFTQKNFDKDAVDNILMFMSGE